MQSSIVPHRIERTHNRHSRAVYRDGEIIIRLAGRLGKREEQEHIAHLLERMQKRVVQEHRKSVIDPFRPLLEEAVSHTVVLDNGCSYLFECVSGPALKLLFCRNGVCSVQVPAEIDTKKLHRLLWKTLAEALVPSVTEWVEDINARTYNVPVDRVRLNMAKTQWGSCNSRGVIMLNTALFFIPHHLAEYVIIHELAHRIHQNHSPRFWKKVLEACPTYTTDRKELKEYRLPAL